MASGQQRLDVALALRPRATIRGRVAWDDGRPAAGVVVCANKKGLITSVPMPGGEHDEELTDADGRFVVRDAPTGTILLTAAGASMEDWAAFPGAEATVYAEPGAVVDAGDLVVSTD